MTRSPQFLGGATPSPPSTSSLVEPPETVAAESDFVIILAALLCALICAVCLVAVARCAWLRSNNAAGQSATTNKGLKKKVLQSLPTFAFDSASNTKLGTAAECAICLAEYSDGDRIRPLPQCGHSFHVSCIDTWLGLHSSCPSCRQILAVARCRKCGDFPAVTGGCPTKAKEEIPGTS